MLGTILVILLFVFTAGQGGAQFVEEQAGADFVNFVHGRNFRALNPHVRVALDVADLKKLATRSK